MKLVTINGKEYRVQANGLVHVLENTRGGYRDWIVLNRTRRASEYRAAIRAAAAI